MRSRLTLVPVVDGPSADDLAAIDAEWPLIAAELDVLDAEIRLLYAEDHGGPSDLDWRRIRRAEAHVTRVATDLASRAARPRPGRLISHHRPLSPAFLSARTPV